MRIGLYGLPTAGKTFVLGAVRNFNGLSGSSLLKALAPDFHSLSAEDKKGVREQLAVNLRGQDGFMMDGHYSFGEEVVFTEEDGKLYDVILYLYIEPSILKLRMADSFRNSKYLEFDIEKWQMFELESLRQYCHEHNKDFYVLDNPGKGYFPDIRIVLEFIDSIAAGYSCLTYAKECVDQILQQIKTKEVCLADGDKTLIIDDSAGVLGYKTHIFDGNFYTGFQAWRHARELTEFLHLTDGTHGAYEEVGVQINRRVIKKVTMPCVILTAGYYEIWKQIADRLEMPVFYGERMSAETKYYITKFLQNKGVRVIAYGDSMNDYYMLKQADEGYLVARSDGTLSRSLKNKKMEGMIIV